MYLIFQGVSPSFGGDGTFRLPHGFAITSIFLSEVVDATRQKRQGIYSSSGVLADFGMVQTGRLFAGDYITLHY